MFTQVQIGSITFNGSDRHYWITDISGLGLPPVRDVDYNLPGQNFGLFVSAMYGIRPFTLNGMILGDSISDLATRRDTFAIAFDILNGEQPIYFTLPNGIIKQINAVCTSIDFPASAGDVTALQFQAQFRATFPFLTSSTTNSYQTGLPIGGGGTIPLPTVPTGLSGNSGGSITVVNNGNAPYYPKITIAGPVTNPQILNQTLGLALALNMTIVSGQTVTIDFKRKTIVDNYGTNLYSNKTGNWWHLSPGSTTILFSASTYNSSALCTLFAQDCYLQV